MAKLIVFQAREDQAVDTVFVVAPGHEQFDWDNEIALAEKRWWEIDAALDEMSAEESARLVADKSSEWYAQAAGLGELVFYRNSHRLLKVDPSEVMTFSL